MGGSRFLSEQNGIDLYSDSKTIAKIIEIYKNTLLGHNTRLESKVRFLTDLIRTIFHFIRN
jgi:hypothetical protein